MKASLIRPINNPNTFAARQNRSLCAENKLSNSTLNKIPYNEINFQACSSLIPFKGACGNLKKMQAYSPEGRSYLLRKDKDGSYLVDSETVTRIYYGKDAEKYLKKTTSFKLDTQIIAPRDCQLKVEVEGREIEVNPNSSIILSKGKEAKISVVKGNPLILTSEREPSWYEKYGRDFDSQFKELSYLNFHLYSGHLKVSDLGEDIVDKLLENNFATQVGEDQIEMNNYFLPEYQKKVLKGILTDEEMTIFNHHYSRAYQIRVSTKEARKAIADELDPKLKEKLIEHKYIADLAGGGKNQIYWRELFSNEPDFKDSLLEAGFSKKEINEVIKFWKRSNKLGFDYTGIKFLSDNFAIYELANKRNNWNGTKTEWYTHSNAATSIEEGAFSPYIGVSEVSARKNFEHAVPFKTIRGTEALHSHPALINKYQSEIYMITEGMAALTVIENNRPKIIVLKEGEGIVIQPGVKHCISAAKGKYEHLACQIPSAFQYGFGLKISQRYPEGYSEKDVTKMAVKKLDSIR